jgi:hypothetical protein
MAAFVIGVDISEHNMAAFGTNLLSVAVMLISP